jgi:hypothetical protein
MALTLFKRQRTQAVGPEPDDLDDDDYLTEAAEIDAQPSAAVRVIHLLEILLILVAGVLSLAIVWLLGVMLNIV